MRLTIPDLQTILDTELARLGQTSNRPGASIAVVQHGLVLDWAVAGLASIEHQRPITPTTTFDIASVSKQMTSTVALSLQRDGLIELDADTRTLVPELDLREPITLRQCLAHTAGLPDYMNRQDLAGRPLGETDGDTGLCRALGSIRSPDSQPGSSIEYSNTGYVLASLAMYRATGRTLVQLASERLFQPLEMSNTTFRAERGLVLPELAWSYSGEHGMWRRHDVDSVQIGDGGVMTTMGDLARWQGFLATGEVLGLDLLEELARPTVLNDGTETRYGLGIISTVTSSDTLLEHSGLTDGFRSYLVSSRKDGLGVMVLANCVAVRPKALAWSVLRELQDLPVPVPTKAPGSMSGAWFDADCSRVMTIEVGPGHSGIRVTYEGQSLDLGLLPRGNGHAWTDSTLHLTLIPNGGAWTMIDRLGGPHRFSKLAPSSSAPPVGLWLGPDDDTLLRFSSSETGLLAAPRRGPAIVFNQIGRTADSSVWTSSFGTLRVENPQVGSVGRAFHTLDGSVTCYVRAES